MLQLQLERLAAAGIQLLPLPNISTHFVFERAGFAALVTRTPEGLGSAGSAGLLTEGGLAALIWRGSQPFFVRKGVDLPASAAQVEALRAFTSDLEQALRANSAPRPAPAGPSRGHSSRAWRFPGDSAPHPGRL